MAKRKSSQNQGSKVVDEKTGLPAPFPCPPTRNPTYAIHCKYPADAPAGQSRLVIQTFSAMYSAKHFLNAALNGRGFKWKPVPSYLRPRDPDTIVTEDNVEIRIPHGRLLEELLEYEMSSREEGWELPDEYTRQLTLLRRQWSEDEPEDEGEDRPKRQKREPKPEKPKIDKTGLVAIGDIAKTMGIDAKEARGALRKAKMEKPAGGWLFKPDQVDGIKETIKKHLK